MAMDVWAAKIDPPAPPILAPLATGLLRRYAAGLPRHRERNKASVAP
jgi:hypothetical protein